MIRVSNSLDPDQTQRYVGSDLDPNCLQKLTADDSSRQNVNGYNLSYDVASGSEITPCNNR